MTLFVIENIDESHLRRLFAFLGVNYFITTYSWMNLPLMAMIGILIALLFAPNNQLLSQILFGIVYGILIILCSFFHGIGHIISSRLVNAPVTSIIMTATVKITQYNDTEEQSSPIHIGRALGGPVFNIILGLVAIALYIFTVKNQFLLFFGIGNLVLGTITILPIPSLDGVVILRELRDWKQ